MRPYAVVPGRLFLSATHLRFVGAAGPKGEGCSQLLEGDWSEPISKDSALLWALASVKQLHRRRLTLTLTLTLTSTLTPTLTLSLARTPNQVSAVVSQPIDVVS